VRVAVGDEVAEGDPVAVLEAMTMESTITAPHSGLVRRIAAQAGHRLEPGDLILELGQRVE
jgi:biotin carboxyl carrier protein